jgi:hypothetical protein
MVAGAFVIIGILITLYIIFRPKPDRYVRNVSSTRNSHEQGFGD